MATELNKKVFETYILKKFIPLLENELYFTRFAKPDMVPKPKPWYVYKWWAIKRYFKHLGRALAGRECEEYEE